jgi:hypothetical protein
LQTRLITDQTFYSRFYRDVGWNFYQFTINPLSEKEIDLSLNNDNKLIDRLKAVSGARRASPLYLRPFQYPASPLLLSIRTATEKSKSALHGLPMKTVQDYLDYLTYTNKRAEEMIDTILKNTGGKAVIILMGDHGLRYHDRLGYNPLFFVQNQNAVYFPDKDYHLFYDSISGVNQFRVVLNSLFRTEYTPVKRFHGKCKR